MAGRKRLLTQPVELLFQFLNALPQRVLVRGQFVDLSLTAGALRLPVHRLDTRGNVALLTGKFIGAAHGFVGALL